MRWNYNDEYRDEFSKGPHRDILIVPHATKVTPVLGGPPEVTSKVPLFNDDGTPQTDDQGNFIMSDVDWVITNEDIVKEQFKYSYSLNPAENITFSSASSAMVQFTIRNNKEYNPDTDTWELDIPNLQYYSYYDKNNNLIIGELDGNYIIKVYTYINGDSSTLLLLGMFRVEEDKAINNGYNRQITAYDFMATFRDMDIFNWYKRLWTGINKLDNDYVDATNKSGEEQKKHDDYDDEVNWVRKPANELYPNRDGRWTVKDALEDLINNLAAFDMIVWSDDGQTAMVGGTSTNPSTIGRDYGEGCGYSGYGMPIIIDPNILNPNAQPYTPTEPGENEYEEYGYMNILELEFYQDPSIMKAGSLSMGKFLEDIGILAGRYPMIRSDKLIEDSSTDYFDPRNVTDPKQSRYNTYEKCILTFKPLPTSKDDKNDSGITKLQPEQQLDNNDIVKGFEHSLFDVKDVMIIKIGMQDGENVEYKILNKAQRKQAETNELQTFSFSNNMFCSYLVDSSDDETIKELIPEYKKIKEKLFGKEKSNHNMTSGALFEQGYYNIKNRSYVPYKLTTYGDPVRDVGDRILINFKDILTGEETSIYTYILERELSGIQKMMDTYKANGQITSPVFSNYQAGTHYQSGFGTDIQMLGYKHSYSSGNSIESGNKGAVVGVGPNDLVGYLRNVGIRLLNEPLSASAKFVKDDNHSTNISYPFNYRFIGMLFNDGNDTVLQDGDTTNPLNIKQHDENDEVYQTTRIAEPYDIVFQTNKDYTEGEAIDYDIPDAYPRTVFIFSEEGTWLEHHTIYESNPDDGVYVPMIADETTKNENNEYDYIEEGFNWDNYGIFFPAYSKLHINGVEVIPKYGDTMCVVCKDLYGSYSNYISYIYPGVWMYSSNFDFNHYNKYYIDDYIDYYNKIKYFKNIYSFRTFGNSIKSQIYDGLKSNTVNLNVLTTYDPEGYEIINYPLSVNDIGVYEYEENNTIKRKICQYTSEGWKTRELGTTHRYSNNIIFRETFHEKIKSEDVTDQNTGIFFEGYSKRNFYTNCKTAINVKNMFDVIELNIIDSGYWFDNGYDYYNRLIRIIYVYPGIWIGIFLHGPEGIDESTNEYYSIFGWQPYIYNDRGISIYNTYTPIMSGLSNESNIELKWEDPNDIDTWKPTPATWKGTVIVRKEDTAPKHKWDGDIIVDNTVRDQYKLEPFHDKNINFNKNYYYNFMPYYTKIDDENHPINFYRFTKTIKVNTNTNDAVIEEVTVSPVIYSIKVIDNIAMVYFTIENFEQHLDSISVIRLYGKENSTPNCDMFDDVIEDFFTTPYYIYDNSSYFVVSSLNNNAEYSFIIYIKDLFGNEIVSNIETIRTNTEQNEIKIFNIDDTNKSLIISTDSYNTANYTIYWINKDIQNLINSNYKRFIFKNPSDDDIFDSVYTNIPMKSNDMDVIHEINFKDISGIDQFSLFIYIYPYYNPNPYNYGTTTFRINIKATNSSTKMLTMDFGDFSRPQELYNGITIYDGYKYSYENRKTIESSQSVLNINDDDEHNIKIIFNYIQIPDMTYGLITALNNVKYSLDNGSLITLYTKSLIPVIDGCLVTSGGYMHEMIPLRAEQPNYYAKKINSYYINMHRSQSAIPFAYSKVVFPTNYDDVFLTLRMDKRNIWQPEPYNTSSWFGNITNECIDSYGVDFSSYIPQIIEDETYLVDPVTIIDNGTISIDIYRTGVGDSSCLYIHILVHSVDDNYWGKNETTISIYASEYIYSTDVAHSHILLYGYEVPRICGWVSLFANSDYTSLHTRWASIVNVSDIWNCPYYPWEPEYEGRTKTNWCTFSPALSNLYINLFPDGEIYELPEVDFNSCLMDANTTVKYNNKIYDLNNRHYILDYKTGICHDMFKNATYDDDWFELENGCRIYSKVKPDAQADEFSTFFAKGLLNAKNIAWIFAEFDIIGVYPSDNPENYSYEYCHFGYLENETEHECHDKVSYGYISTFAIDLNNITTDTYIKLFLKTFNGPYYNNDYKKAIYEINRIWIIGTKDFNLTTDYVNDD